MPVSLKHELKYYYNYILYQSALELSERIVLHWLINHDFEASGKRKGFVWYTPEKIAKELNLSVSTIYRHLASLSEKGLIERRWMGKQAKHTIIRYDNLEQMMEGTSVKLTDHFCQVDSSPSVKLTDKIREEKSGNQTRISLPPPFLSSAPVSPSSSSGGDDSSETVSLGGEKAKAKESGAGPARNYWLEIRAKQSGLSIEDFLLQQKKSSLA